MKAFRELLTDDEGFATVIVAMAMSVIIGFTALGTDLGLVYLNKLRISNALDSGVLAGVQELPDKPQAALNIATEYAVANGLKEGEFDFELGEDNRSITGRASRELGLFFARAVGITSTSVNLRSKAQIAPITGARGVVPFGVGQGDYTVGEDVILKLGAGNPDCHGSFGALRMGGNGASVYQDNIQNGSSDLIKIGDVINVETGNMSGPTSKGIAYRINQCHHVPQCSIHSYVEGCSRICTVPLGIYSMDNGSNKSFTVTGFAAFLIDEYVGNGKDNELHGSFIKYIAFGTSSEEAQDFGLYGVELVE